MGEVIHYCDFCGRHSKEALNIIVSESGAKICNNCISGCVEILISGGKIKEPLHGQQEPNNNIETA